MLYHVKTLSPLCDDLSGARQPIKAAHHAEPLPITGQQLRGGPQLPSTAPLCAALSSSCPSTAPSRWSPAPAAATYPPQDPEELASAAEALATSCALLLEECPEGAPSAAADSAPAQEQSQERGPVALQAPMEEVMNTHRGLVQQLAAGNDDAAQ